MSKKIFVAGHRGMVGSSLCRNLQQAPDSPELVTASRDELDLTDTQAVESFLKARQVDEIYLAAAKVGGIHANNTQRVEFLLDNLNIQNSVIAAAHRADVNRLLFLGSSCIYPKLAEQPMREEALLTSSLEQTNEPYALAKITGLKLCESYNRQYGRDYRAAMPTNLYGEGDNFHPTGSHVIPALLSRFHDAKEAGSESVTVWGTGKVFREFMYVDDLADACVHIMNVDADKLAGVTTESCQHINVGTGEEHTIAALCDVIAATVNFAGAIEYDASKPDGTPRKLLDTSRLNKLGWHNKVDLQQGLAKTYEWFLANIDALRK